MGGEGYMLDMIRRLSEGREASRLRRERANDKLKHLNRTNEPYPLPNTTPEEMERIIHDSEKKKEKNSNFADFISSPRKKSYMDRWRRPTHAMTCAAA